MPRESGAYPDRVTMSADNAAAAALRELPGARVVVSDRALRLILSAGHAAEQAVVVDPGAPGAGGFVGDAFADKLWRLIEPLFRSALDGETRSREILHPDADRSLMGDVGPRRLDGPSGGGGA